MIAETIRPYRHSGKFPVQGPILAVAAGALVSLPLGFAYAYLNQWIPSIYLNILITIGYGFGFGFLTGWVLKFTKVRNNSVAALTAFVVGLCALYGCWNGHLHAMTENAPLLAPPSHIWGMMKILYEFGSWGMRSGENVTGIPLVIVWVVEAGMIIGFTVFTGWSWIAATPFCETCQRWLDQKRTLDTLAPFTDPVQRAALKSGELGPLLDAKPRAADSWSFARVTLQYSPACDTFCTMRLENVTAAKNAKGETKEKKESLTDVLALPHAMRELIEKFASFETPAVPATSPLETPPKV
jgi:hypothetical protein